MKVVSTEALTKLIQLVKSAFIKVDDVVEVTEIETETPSEITLATVATSGSYDDLSDKPSAVTEATVSGWGFTKNTGTVTSVNNVSPVNGNVTLFIPTVPTNISAFTNDSGYITSSALTGYATENWVGQQGYITGITSSDVTTALGYTPYNSSNPNGYITSSALMGYAAESYVDTGLASKQAILVSGTNIKTINNQSILGSGDLAISSRNIGEIVSSTIPLTDAGLHLLDGALISGSGSYADFVTYIAGLVSTYPDLFETEANWQTSVTNYGTCGKFVYDSVNNTVRLPKITGFIEGTTDLTALGDLIQAGLPNITGTMAQTRFAGTGTNCFSGSTKSTSNNGFASGSSTWGTLDFKASNSNNIYGSSSTVQPQAIKVLYYICISTSTKTDIQIDIDEIATDLNGKADVDLSNTSPSQTFKNNVMNWVVPDYNSAVSLGISVKNSSYTIQNTGYYLIKLSKGTAARGVKITVNDIAVMWISIEAAWESTKSVLLLNQGDVVSCTDADAIYGADIEYYLPFKGVN